MSGISKFGDVLVNFVMSAAIYRVSQGYDGIKVSNHVLMQALLQSSVKSPPRTDKHQKGDFVEAYVAAAWNNPFTTDDMITILANSLEGKDLSSRQGSIDAQIDAVAALINAINGD